MTTNEEKARRMEIRRQTGTRRKPKVPEPRGPSTPYSIAYACFLCQKSFKITVFRDPKCPDCAAKLHEMGPSFKAPKKSDDEQWKKVIQLWEAGFRFGSYRSYPGAEPLPTALKEVAEFIARNPDHPMRVSDKSK